MKRTTRGWYVFLCCVLSVPTCAYFMEGIYAESPESALIAGALLGVAHVLLRPLLRLFTAPIGCLTLGLFGMVIDVGLIYGCASLIDGFDVLSLPYALLMALIVNIACAAIGGRKN